MQIHGASHVAPAHSISGPQFARTEPTAPAAGGPIVDSLELSAEADAASGLSDVGGLRLDRINQIRAELANGTYDTEEKLSSALDRFLDQYA